MKTMRRAKQVGKFAVRFEVANYGDVLKQREGAISAKEVRRLKLKGVVDSGAVRLVLPERAVKKLGLPSAGRVRVRYADGRKGNPDSVEGIYVGLLGRHGVFDAIVEPGRRTALIGAVVLEVLDFLVDCTNQRLVPRDARFITSEIE